MLDTLNFKTYILFTPQHFQPSRYSRVGSTDTLANLKGLLHLRDRNADEGMFPALHTLSITVSSIYKYAPFLQRPDILRWVDILWRSVMKSPLTSLTLNVAIEAYRDDVVPSTLFIPTLSNLTLVIWAGYSSTDYKLYLPSKLAPLINRHAGSLCRLSVEVQEAGIKVHPRYYDSSPLFQHLQYLPKLDSIEVRIPLLTPSQTDLGSLHEFLQAHSQQVVELTLHLFHSLLHQHPFEPFLVHPYSEADLLRLPFFESPSLALPSLRMLEFAVFHRDSEAFPTACFLGWIRGHPSWSSTLKSLCLTSHYLPLMDAIQILSSVQFTALTELSLSVRFLPLDFVVRLRSTLPRLKELTLIVMHWIQKLELNVQVTSMFHVACIAESLSDLSNQGNGVADLVEDIRILSQDRRHLFANWYLRRLTICIGKRSQRNRLRQDGERRKFFVALFPNVGIVEYFDSYGMS